MKISKTLYSKIKSGQIRAVLSETSEREITFLTESGKTERGKKQVEKTQHAVFRIYNTGAFIIKSGSIQLDPSILAKDLGYKGSIPLELELFPIDKRDFSQENYVIEKQLFILRF